MFHLRMLAVGSFGVIGLGLLALTTINAQEKNDAPPKTETVRFDKKVREDIFAGLGGDEEAMKKGMAACEEELKTNPKNGQALVWHATGLMFQARKAFSEQKMNDGFKAFRQSIKEFDQGVALEPKSPGTRIPRAIVYTATFPNIPNDAIKKDLKTKAKEDLEFLEKLHDTDQDWDNIGTHRRGELLMALAMFNRHDGQEDAAKKYLERITVVNKGSKYDKIAQEWLKDPKLKTHNCIGCHSAAK